MSSVVSLPAKISYICVAMTPFAAAPDASMTAMLGSIWCNVVRDLHEWQWRADVAGLVFPVRLAMHVQRQKLPYAMSRLQ